MTLARRKGIREEDRRRRHWINTKGGVINLHPQRLHKCGVSGRPAHSKLLLFMVPPVLLTQTCCDTAWRRAPQELYSTTFPCLTYASLRLHQASSPSCSLANCGVPGDTTVRDSGWIGCWEAWQAAVGHMDERN